MQADPPLTIHVAPAGAMSTGHARHGILGQFRSHISENQSEEGWSRRHPSIG